MKSKFKSIFCYLFTHDNSLIFNRFYLLKTGIRLRDPAKASKIIACCAMIHNMCIDDHDLEVDEEDENEPMDEDGPAIHEVDPAGDHLDPRDRRTQLVNYFNE